MVQYLFQLGALVTSLSLASATPPHGFSAPRDSTDIRRQAERMQQRFERTRRQHLPWGYGSSGPCDIRMGQYCFTFDDNERDWDPPAEHPDVITAREELINALDSLHAKLPGDEWILTQLVRYGVESRRFDLVEHAAITCTLAKVWLCHALAGYVHHATQDYTTAEDAFDLALVLMASRQRCEWEDLSDLLAGGVRGKWRDRGCQDRSGMLDTLFWLSDPLHYVAGNELRTEHFARQVASLMYRQARGPSHQPWNAIEHRIITRYGWPRGWERIREYRTSLRPPMVTHYGLNGAATFFPTIATMVSDPTSIAQRDWDMDPPRPQSSHGPPYASEAFEDVTVDVALFRRGDSTTLVSAISLSHDGLSLRNDTEFAVAISKNPQTLPRIWSAVANDTTHVLIATAMASPHLVSFEVLARAAGVAGRSRFGIDLSRLHRPGLVVSDVLVLHTNDSLPTGLEQAVALIRRPSPYRPGERFALYWELYGTQSQVTYSTSLSLDKTNKGIFRRLAELTPFTSHNAAVRVAWDDTARDQFELAPRSIAVDLPTQLSAGRYRLTLTIEASTGERHERIVDMVVASH